jgi:hypothetical protein
MPWMLRHRRAFCFTNSCGLPMIFPTGGQQRTGSAAASARVATSPLTWASSTLTRFLPRFTASESSPQHQDQIVVGPHLTRQLTGELSHLSDRRSFVLGAVGHGCAVEGLGLG